MVKFPRFAVVDSADRIQCTTCRGKGYYSVQGFDGGERQTCDACQGFGGWEWVEPVDIDVALDAVATVTEIERNLNPAITVNHPNMTPAWFDKAIKRAHDAGLTIRFADNGTAYVTSASDPTVSYLVDRTSCGCRGHLGHGRCLHRALFIAYVDVFGAPVAEPIAA